MEKIAKPKKLIRYDSMEGITQKKPLRFTTRIAAYSVVLTLLLGVLTYLLISRKPVAMTILRTSGMLYQQPDSLTISNLYNVELVNKTPNAMDLEFRIKENIGTIKFVNDAKTLHLPSQNDVKGVFFVLIPKKDIHQLSTKITIQIYQKNELLNEQKTTFLSPSVQ
jgi:polyferredoxin